MDFERINSLNPEEMINRVGNLYNFEEVPSEVADRVEDMTTLQDDLMDFLKEVQALNCEFNQLVEINKKLKETNTKLMYDSIRRNPQPTKTEKEADAIEQAEKNAENIDIYEED